MSEHAYAAAATSTGTVWSTGLVADITAALRAPQELRVHIVANATRVLVLFNPDLTAAEALTLDATIAAHVGTVPPPAAEPKLWRYIQDRDLRKLKEVDYRRGLSQRLHAEPVFSALVKGEVSQVNFYATAVLQPDGVTIVFSDLVVREDHTYVRDVGGVAVSQQKTLRWYDEAGAEIALKTRDKLYSVSERIGEGTRRRTNHVNTLQFNTLGMIMLTQAIDSNAAQVLGIPFISAIQTEMDLYVKTGDSALLTAAINAINTATTHTWLENVVAAGPPAVTIKDAILAEFA